MSEDYFWTENKDGVTTVGLSESGREELGHITFVNLPKNGANLTKTSTLVNVEADKAVSDISSPVEGKIVEVNKALAENPELLNSDDKNTSWIAKIQN